MWKAFYKSGLVQTEDDPGVGRPVQAGEDGELLCIAQEDFGHKVAIDLINGTVCLEYDSIGIQNGTIELSNPGVIFSICEETNIVGDYKHLKQEFVDWRDEDGRKILSEDGRYTKVRNDILTDLIWRPIWFTRTTSGVPAKVIGAQTTTPEIQGSKNIKKLIILFSDGRLGID